jgi:hypothetical protein
LYIMGEIYHCLSVYDMKDRVWLLLGLAIVGLALGLAVAGVREAQPVLTQHHIVADWSVEGGEALRRNEGVVINLTHDRAKASTRIEVPMFAGASLKLLDEGRNVKRYYAEVGGRSIDLSRGSWPLKETSLDIGFLSFYGGGSVTLVKEGGEVVVRDPAISVTQLQPLPLLTLAAGSSLAAYGLVRMLTTRRTVVTDLSCGNVGRIKLKGPLESTLRLLGFDRVYDRPKPRVDSIHVITSGDTLGFPKSRPWLRFLYVIIPDKPPEHESPAWIAGSRAWKRMARQYNPSVDRAGVGERGEPKESSSPAGRRADIVREQVSNPYVNRLIRLGVNRRAPTSSKYVNVDACLETGTAAGVFPLAANELLARVQRRQLTTVTILSEPARLGLVRVRDSTSVVMGGAGNDHQQDRGGPDNEQGGSDIERYLSNARLMVRDGREIFQAVDAIFYIEQEEAERSKMDNVIGEFKALLYTAAVESLYGDIGNLRSVAGYSKVLVPIKLQVTRVADSVAVTRSLEVAPLKADALEDVKVAGKPVFLLATMPPEPGAARLMDQLVQAVDYHFAPKIIESCLVVAPLPNPIAYLLVPLSYEEVDCTAFGHAIGESGYTGSEQYFRMGRGEGARPPAAVEGEGVTGPRVERGRIVLR